MGPATINSICIKFANYKKAAVLPETPSPTLETDDVMFHEVKCSFCYQGKFMNVIKRNSVSCGSTEKTYRLITACNKECYVYKP
jgi:hypothetical protein